MLFRSAESCELRGYCSIQNVINRNGDIYPCNFYMNDEYKIGNIKDVKVENIIKEKKSIEFVKSSLNLKEKCKKCEVVSLCKGGCKKYKVGNNSEYYFCTTFKDFYKYSLNRFIKICREIKAKDSTK